MVLAKHHGKDLHKFLHLPNIGSQIVFNSDSDEPDAIVIGTGLPGLAATLNILDCKGKVILIEKEHHMGENSNKASSGINACCPQNSTYGDFLDSYRDDTVQSAGQSAWLELIHTLWLKEHVGVDLSVLSQLGGHRYKHMHHIQSGMVRAEIIYNIQRVVKGDEKLGMVQIFMDTRVTSKKNDEGAVVGLEAITTTKGKNETIIIMARM
ncbi:hypothetical protein ACHAW6_006135 [Cyclotella cf. meneghiniana]